MRYLKELKEGDNVSGIYLCKHKQAALTKNGKSYESVILQDKTGTMDAKVWDPNSQGIGDYDVLDYIDVCLSKYRMLKKPSDFKEEESEAEIEMLKELKYESV